MGKPGTPGEARDLSRNQGSRIWGSDPPGGEYEPGGLKNLKALGGRNYRVRALKCVQIHSQFALIVKKMLTDALGLNIVRITRVRLLGEPQLGSPDENVPQSLSPPSTS